MDSYACEKTSAIRRWEKNMKKVRASLLGSLDS